MTDKRCKQCNGWALDSREYQLCQICGEAWDKYNDEFTKESECRYCQGDV